MITHSRSILKAASVTTLFAAGVLGLSGCAANAPETEVAVKGAQAIWNHDDYGDVVCPDTVTYYASTTAVEVPRDDIEVVTTADETWSNPQGDREVDAYKVSLKVKNDDTVYNADVFVSKADLCVLAEPTMSEEGSE